MKGCEGRSLGDSSPEIKIILLFMSIFTGCLLKLDHDAADAVCREIEAIVVHSIDSWLIYSTDYYKVFVLSLFDSFYLACRDLSLSPICRDRYKGVTVNILHFYSAIGTTASSEVEKHYPHVIEVLEILRAAYDCQNAFHAFSQINKKLSEARVCANEVRGKVLSFLSIFNMK